MRKIILGNQECFESKESLQNISEHALILEFFTHKYFYSSNKTGFVYMYIKFVVSIRVVVQCMNHGATSQYWRHAHIWWRSAFGLLSPLHSTLVSLILSTHRFGYRNLEKVRQSSVVAVLVRITSTMRAAHAAPVVHIAVPIDEEIAHWTNCRVVQAGSEAEDHSGRLRPELLDLLAWQMVPTTEPLALCRLPV